MSAQAVAAAFLALFPEGVTVHDVQVPDLPTYPYAAAQVSIPIPAGRAVSFDRQGVVVRARVTIAAGTAEGVRIVSDLVDAALDGAVPTATGYRFGRVGLRNVRETAQDFSVTIPSTKRHPVYAVLEYEFTAATAS